MSTLVELPPNEYDPAAFKDFDPEQTNFTINNARAMMWFSQLAYETGKPETIEFVGSKFGFTSVFPFVKSKVGPTAIFETCGIIGERPKAVVLAFAGTDPLVWENLATDVGIQVTGRNTHRGFQEALEGVLAEVDQAIQASQQGGKPLFIAGHSLGAALAVLAAQHADDQGAAPKAIYVFGMPRVGGEKFRADYNAKLGPITYRLVHGDDVVASIPRSGSDFRHVGRLLRCDSGNKFSSAHFSDIDLDEPDLGPALVGGLMGLLSRNLSGLLSRNLLARPGPGPFGHLFQFLPQPIRDHLQDRYWTALGS
jgi:triacylglycerol lipase